MATLHPESLIGSIYDVIDEPDRWDVLLQQLADLTGSTGGVIHCFSKSTGQVTFSRFGRLDPDLGEICERVYADNPWSASVARGDAGAIVTCDSDVPLPQLKREAFYADILHPQRLSHNLGVVLAEQGPTTVMINICRTGRQGPAEAAEVARLAHLLPHLRRAARLQARAAPPPDPALDILDHLGIGAAVVTAAGTLSRCSGAARQMLTAAGLIRPGAADTLAGSAKAMQLRKDIRAAIDTQTPRKMVFDAPELGRPVIAVVTPLPDAWDGPGPDRAAWPALVVLGCAGSLPLISAPHLQRRFDLTRAETRTAAALIEGQDLAGTAAQLGITVNTLKTHARRIFMKTGTHRQAELIRLAGEIVLGSAILLGGTLP